MWPWTLHFTLQCLFSHLKTTSDAKDLLHSIQEWNTTECINEKWKLQFVIDFIYVLANCFHLIYHNKFITLTNCSVPSFLMRLCPCCVLWPSKSPKPPHIKSKHTTPHTHSDTHTYTLAWNKLMNVLTKNTHSNRHSVPIISSTFL